MLRAVLLLAATFLALIYWPTMNAELQADELLSLIAAVEENERLYSNIDIKVQFAYASFPPFIEEHHYGIRRNAPLCQQRQKVLCSCGEFQQN